MFLRFRKKTPISALDAGRIHTIEGVVTSPDSVPVPDTRIKCVYYFMFSEVYRKGPRGRGRPLWFVEGQRTGGTGFEVSDDTGTVWVSTAEQPVDLAGAARESGHVGKKGRRRYSVDFIRNGDTVRIRGEIENGGTGAESGLSITSPQSGKALEVLVRKISQKDSA